MPRNANAIDFWRGFALVTIFINHVPGIYFERFTHRNVSISDSAELFVFLAGWALRLSIGRPGEVRPLSKVVVTLTKRAFKIYVAQILITALALAILAGAARAFDDPLVLEWHNAAAVFYNPIETHIGLVLLSHQLGYFDILPLYVVLMIFAPVIALMHRLAPAVLLPASATLYLTALIFRISMPTWPTQGHWFFNPFAWQFIFVLGFLLGANSGVGAFARRNLQVLRIIAVPVVILGTFIVLTAWWPDPTKVPEPRLLFIADKVFMTPLRLLQFLALAALGTLPYPYLIRWLPKPVNWLSMLGRNSLNVFCAASVLSLVAQIVRYAYNGDLWADTIIVILGLVLLGLTARLSEERGSIASKERTPA